MHFVCINQTSLCHYFLRWAEPLMGFWQVVTGWLCNQSVHPIWIFTTLSFRDLTSEVRWAFNIFWQAVSGSLYNQKVRPLWIFTIAPFMALISEVRSAFKVCPVGGNWIFVKSKYTTSRDVYGFMYHGFSSISCTFKPCQVGNRLTHDMFLYYWSANHGLTVIFGLLVSKNRKWVSTLSKVFGPYASSESWLSFVTSVLEWVERRLVLHVHNKMMTDINMFSFGKLFTWTSSCPRSWDRVVPVIVRTFLRNT